MILRQNSEVTAATFFLLLLATAQAPERRGAAPPPKPAPDPAAIAARAVELQKQGKLEDAAEEYRRFLQLSPKSWEARSNLGVVYAQLGRFDEAVTEYREALAAHPSAVAVRYNLAVALYKGVHFGEAATELEAVLKTKPDHPQAPLLLADCRLLLGEWKQVIAILDPLLEGDPDNKAILYMLGTALMRDHQAERGQRVLDRILRQGDSAEAHLVLAIASREANDDIAAEKELRRALELDPNLPTANGILGDVLVRMGEGAAAVAALSRELEVNPNHFESHLLLGLLLRQESKTAEAMGHLQKALVLRPGDPGVRYQIALVEIAESDLARARATLDALVKDEPRFTEAHVSLATVYYRLGLRADGQRHQAIVQQLKRDEKAREDEEKARQQGVPAPPP
jgi:tetratricopeptide (TPR) repeat protein